MMLSKAYMPVLATGRQSEDGSSFVMSESGTEEADNEIRRICFGNNNLLRMTTTGGGGAGSSSDEPTSRLMVISRGGGAIDLLDDDDDDLEEEGGRDSCRRRLTTSAMAKYKSTEHWDKWASLPTRRKKAAILQYFAFARLFRVVTVSTPGDKEPPVRCCLSGRDIRITEMQITDCDGCPLFDAWLQKFAWSPTGNRWVVEACGNIILTIQRSPESALTTVEKSHGDRSSPRTTRSSSGAKRLFPRSPADHELNKIAWRRWSIIDWNGEYFGYLVASGSGEAVFLETADKETVGKFVRQCAMTRRIRTDSADNDFSNTGHHHHHASMLALTPRRRANRRNLASSCGGVQQQRITWTCVHHETGQRLMRLDDDEVASFDTVQGVSLATKLLILAGIVKIVGDSRHGGGSSGYSCGGLFGGGENRGRSCFK